MKNASSHSHKATCSSCLKTKLQNAYSCALCQISLCKDCAQFQDTHFFSFWEHAPEILKHSCYCPHCHEEKIKPAQENYLEILDRAKKVYVFFKKHAIPLVNQSKQPVTVVDCPDYDDALLHLAFGAAKQSFNALIEVQLVSKKMNTQGYQNLLWSGKGLPANIRGEVIEKRDSMGIIEKPQPERISKKKK